MFASHHINLFLPIKRREGCIDIQVIFWHPMFQMEDFPIPSVPDYVPSSPVTISAEMPDTELPTYLITPGDNRAGRLRNISIYCSF